MIAVGSALAAAAVVLALALVVFYVVSRGRTGLGGELERRLEASNARFEGKLADLEWELERAREENRRARQLAAIGSTIDLDAVLSRALEA
ncbi:MAG: hypothetical protein M3310_00485, partial [Actinomycetota bacterium]|nr:hypothetical protein [Actinomycetota bacterium]